MPVITEAGASGPTIVVLDDDPAVGRFVARVALAQGFEVVMHTCAAAFASDDRVAGAALVLLDLDLGHTDGVRVLRDLASSSWIVPLTRVVLESAARQAAVWRAEGWEATVAVNVPADMLTDLELPDRIRALLKRHGLPGEALSIEVTESEVARDLLNAMDVLARLRLMGLGLSVDDFGTGHSSLVKLRDLPFDEVKIDRTFTARIEEDPHTRALTRATIRLGQSLGMRVVAEGVETQAVSDWLKRNGCDVGQGYLYGRPIAPEAFAWRAQIPRDAGEAPGRRVAQRPAA